MSVLLTLLITLCATVAILNIGRFTRRALFSLSHLEYVNRQLIFQALLFVVAMLVLGGVYLLNAPNLSQLFTPGNISAPAGEVFWLGIAEGESWFGVGASFTFFITLVTSAFIYLKYRKSVGRMAQAVPYIAWILLFALTNSFSEEMIYRMGVIVPLYGSFDRNFILLFSAVAFGVPHLRGMPNGVVGAFMAGFLGWLLAKSVVETGGIFWAWWIHFLQDVVIFSAFVLSEVNKSSDRQSQECDSSVSG
ncbi:MAG: CPBP family intramembrane metalloprotease [Chlorobiaceae bacterium]|nr:CPBP family intramembrane metalloprotease [Chlorobiaceae bacterium]